MSNDYSRVREALNEGADPTMLCTTCPWDRLCVEPPAMTKEEIDAKVAESQAKDDEKAAAARAEGKEAGMPVGSLLTILTFSGKDSAGTLCPVFALRLRSSDGRAISDGLKRTMEGL